MSQWTHIAGCIRVDRLPVNDTKSNQPIREKFAAPPVGSEGPIQYRVVNTGDENSLAWGLVYVYGDLRDFGDAEVPEIIAWLQNACKDLMIRSCCVKIDVEYGPTHVITDTNDNQLTTCVLQGTC